MRRVIREVEKVETIETIKCTPKKVYFFKVANPDNSDITSYGFVSTTDWKNKEYTLKSFDDITVGNSYGKIYNFISNLLENYIALGFEFYEFNSIPEAIGWLNKEMNE